jgi:hypothetical protein
MLHTLRMDSEGKWTDKQASWLMKSRIILTTGIGFAGPASFAIFASKAEDSEGEAVVTEKSASVVNAAAVGSVLRRVSV